MNKIYALVLILFNSMAAAGQTPLWQWAKSAGGFFHDYGNGISTDTNGNSYVAGTFQSPSITFGGITLTNADNSGVTNDIFIVKYDASGNALWAKKAGGISDDYGNGICVDAAGNAYMTGYFISSSITFGSYTLTNPGGVEIFTVKYDASGNVLWAKSAGGSGGYDYGFRISLDISGNSYVTGIFESQMVSFGSINLNNTNSSGSDIFIAKYDPMGNIIWAKSAGGMINEYSNYISTDADGNSYLTGSFNSDSISFGSIKLYSSGQADAFIAKYDSSGSVLWAIKAGGALGEAGLCVSVDANGNSYLTGYFQSDTITFDSIDLLNGGGYDIFIVKYDAGGNAVWAKSEGGTSFDFGDAIKPDLNGNVYVLGHFWSPTILLDTIILTNTGLSNAFVAKYTASGNILWAKSFGGPSTDTGLDICGDPFGNFYITGMFRSPSILFDGTLLVNAGGGSCLGGCGDFLIAKLDNITGMLENDKLFQATNIFPNPVTDILTIEVTNNSHEVSEVIIYDIASQNILQQKFINSVSLNTEQLAKGLYLYEVRDRNGLCKKGKIVKD